MGPVVLDTNVILLYLAGKQLVLPAASLLRISFITEMELLSFPGLTSEEEKAIRGFCGDVTRIGLNDEIKDRAILIRRATRIKLPDAIIAATALIHDWRLISADKDFERVANLRLASPSTIQFR